ncbi:S4 domain-containing protein YaaA [Streptococcus gallolyticus]|uniref:S4 domain-containing protein YaaA n=1 Tax=Streptococcus hepaticus TaxID=3349163 RepID=UPI001C96D680|nr:S4 domain-containing protein YaaA [Streptococcus gallolyticus]MBY5040790.1 S4 domain-containing protein YaaA [Streptococcus gallolyticus]
MKYKLFEEYITLQALLKNVGILSSGGAIKAFLAENTVLFNGQDEKRRGKKIRVNDIITLPAQKVEITLVAPSEQEIEEYKADLEEKARVAALVKEMNKKVKKASQKTNSKQAKQIAKKPVRFPGT